MSKYSAKKALKATCAGPTCHNPGATLRAVRRRPDWYCTGCAKIIDQKEAQ